MNGREILLKVFVARQRMRLYLSEGAEDDLPADDMAVSIQGVALHDA